MGGLLPPEIPKLGSLEANMEITIMKNLTVKKIKQIAHKEGVIIAIAHPSEWGITCSKKRAYSYSAMDNNGYWHEPNTVNAWSLQQLHMDILEFIEYNRGE